MASSFDLETYSISLEELSLAFGMINRPDMADAWIRTIYPDISNSQYQVRMIGAVNALLACQLATLSEKRLPRLSPDFEKIIFSLSFFDYSIQLSKMVNGSMQNTTVTIQKGKTFTCHSIEQGVLHKIETGKITDLPQYADKYFSSLAIGKTSKNNLGDVPRELLDKRENKKENEGILIENGWSKADASSFADVLKNPTFAGSIVFVDANGRLGASEVLSANKRSIILFYAKKKSWVVDYPDSEASAGTATLFEGKDFSEFIKDIF
jgi:hypothetical protein